MSRPALHYASRMVDQPECLAKNEAAYLVVSQEVQWKAQLERPQVAQLRQLVVIQRKACNVN